MKILKILSGTWTHECTCKNCETGLLIEEPDVKYGRFFSGMDAQVSMDFYAVCPTCEQNIFLNDADVPRYLQAKLIKEFKS